MFFLLDKVKRIELTLAVIIILPFLFLVFGCQNWFFDFPGYLDPFTYVGYFLHYPEHLPLLESHYKSSRLPWVLPGTLSYQLFGPVAGSYVLHSFFVVLALTSLYLTLKSLFNAKIAFLSTLILAGYPPFYGAGGWNYHSMAAIAYYFLVMLSLTYAAKSSSSRRWLWVAGISYACAVHTTSTAALFAPLLIIHWLVLNHLEQQRSLIHSAGNFLMGGLFITLVLALINYSTGGQFWFFLAQINYTLQMSKGNPWYQPISVWIGESYYLVLPIITLLSIFFLAIFNPTTTINKQQRIIIESLFGQLFLIGILLFYFGEVKQQPILSPNYMFHLFFAPMTFAIGGILVWRLATSINQLSEKFLVSSALLIYGIPLWVIPEASRVDLFNWINLRGGLVSQWPIIIPLTIGLLGFLSVFWFSKWKYSILVLLTFLSISSIVKPSSGSKCCFNRDLFKAVIDAEHFVTTLDPTLVNLKYWFNPKERLSGDQCDIKLNNVFDSLVATRLWCVNFVAGCVSDGEHRPPGIFELSDEVWQVYQKIAILSNVENQDKYVTDMQNRFKQLGKVLTPIGNQIIESGKIKFAINAFDISISRQLVSTEKIQGLVQQAIQIHQAGNLPQAENLYRQVLQVQPKNSEALHFLGVIAGQMGNYPTAIELMKQSIAINHKAPLFFSNLAGVLQLQGKVKEAIACYQRALALNPQDTSTQQQLDKMINLEKQWLTKGEPLTEVDRSSPCLTN